MRPKKRIKLAALCLTAAMLTADFYGAGQLAYASQPEASNAEESLQKLVGDVEENSQKEENTQDLKETKDNSEETQNSDENQSPDQENSDENQSPDQENAEENSGPENPEENQKQPEDLKNGVQGNSGDSKDDQENQDKREIKEEEMQELLGEVEREEEQKELSPEEAFAELLKEYDMYGVLTGSVEFLVRQEASRDAAVVQTLPSGHQVKLTGVVLTDADVWFQISFAVNDTEYSGYLQSDFIVSQDERLSAWRDQYLAAGGSRALSRVNASGNTDLNAFPSSYRSYIQSLIKAHPNWTFVPMNTNLNWDDVLKAETADAVSLVENRWPATWKSTDSGSYNMETGEWYIKNGTTWVQASESLVRYYLDPRNFLNEESVFQFEQLTYNKSAHTEDGVEKILSGTFMSHKKLEDGSGDTYAKVFMEIGKELKVSPYFLASRVRQEQGTQGNSSLISGTYPGYEGYYNYFNIGATGIGNDVITSGLTEAQNEGWNSRYKALKGGASKAASRYIARGQDTFYLQKFDVDSSYDGLYWHQYMQHLLAADLEGKKVQESYKSMGALNNSFVFKVPVYENMPSKPMAKPEENLSKPSLKASNNGGTSVKLSWETVSGAAGYRIYRAEGDGSYTKLKTVSGLMSTSYEDRSVVPGKKYNYKIRAYLQLKEGKQYSSYSDVKTIDYTVPAVSWNKFSVKNYKTIELSWKKAEADGYKIYRKTGSGSYSCIKTIAGKSNLTFKDTSVVPGNTYTYRIRSYRRVNGKDYYSSYTSVKTAEVKMSKPKLEKGYVSGGKKVKLTWKRDSKGDGYDIYRATSKNGKYTKVKSVTSNKTVSWSDSSMTTGKTYYYKIRSYSKTSAGTKRSGYSNILQVKTKLSKVKVTSIKASEGKIKLKWKKDSNATGYKIYRATSKKGKYKVVKKITKNSTVNWTDKNLTGGKTYYYKIRSYADNGKKTKYGSYSSVTSAKAKVSGTKFTKVSSSNAKKVTLKWEKQDKADGYKIYRKTGKNGTYKEIKTISKSKTVSYTNGSLKSGTTYYYKIRTYKKVDGKIKYSAYSAEKRIQAK